VLLQCFTVDYCPSPLTQSTTPVNYHSSLPSPLHQSNTPVLFPITLPQSSIPDHYSSPLPLPQSITQVHYLSPFPIQLIMYTYLRVTAPLAIPNISYSNIPCQYGPQRHVNRIKINRVRIPRIKLTQLSLVYYLIPTKFLQSASFLKKCLGDGHSFSKVLLYAGAKKPRSFNHEQLEEAEEVATFIADVDRYSEIPILLGCKRVQIG